MICAYGLLLRRCFPHVVNLAAQVYIAALPEAAKQFRESLRAQGEIPPKIAEYLDALESDAVAACRKTVVACRSSGLRRDSLKHSIEEGNAAGRFKTPSGTVIQIPVLEPILDCPTRWASACAMIQRFWLLYLVSLYSTEVILVLTNLLLTADP